MRNSDPDPWHHLQFIFIDSRCSWRGADSISVPLHDKYNNGDALREKFLKGAQASLFRPEGTGTPEKRNQNKLLSIANLSTPSGGAAKLKQCPNIHSLSLPNSLKPS